jgi:carboxymethylenebutenolidase
MFFWHPGLQREIDRARFTHTDAVMTGEVVSLRAHDGHVLSAYQARPDKPPRGGLVLLQEIFGVTAHIRRVCDGYAAQGYHVVAPALFDRVRPGIELGYSKQDAATGRDLRSRVPWDHVFADVIAAKAQLSGSGKIAALGYCWGGTIAWRSAVHVVGVAAAVCYYATQIGPFIAEKPRCAVLMHFGESDPIATLDHAGSCVRPRARRLRSKFIPQVTDSTVTRSRASISRVPRWRSGARWCFWPPISGENGSSCSPSRARGHDIRKSG